MTSKQLFYEMTITGNVFNLVLDGNPTLAGTKYTLLKKRNSIKPESSSTGEQLMTAVTNIVKSKTNKKKEEEGRRRRLLGYEDDWSEFTTYVETTQGTCNSKLLNHVSVYDGGTFNFQCSKSGTLCNCIQHVGATGEEQHFVVDNIALIIFRHEDIVGYEITEDDISLVYGDVNEGREDRRRRRLLGNHRGGC